MTVCWSPRQKGRGKKKSETLSITSTTLHSHCLVQSACLRALDLFDSGCLEMLSQAAHKPLNDKTEYKWKWCQLADKKCALKERNKGSAGSLWPHMASFSFISPIKPDCCCQEPTCNVLWWSVVVPLTVFGFLLWFISARLVSRLPVLAFCLMHVYVVNAVLLPFTSLKNFAQILVLLIVRSSARWGLICHWAKTDNKERRETVTRLRD